MTEQQHPHLAQNPSAGPAEHESRRDGARRWLAGATLVTVGLVAGAGTTYAFTSLPTVAVPSEVAGYGRSGYGGLTGGSPGGPGAGTPPDQQPGATDEGTAGTADGEAT